MDWGENVGFMALVAGLPNQPMWLAQLTLGLHDAKLVFLMAFNVSVWILLAAVIAVQIKKLFRKIGSNRHI